VAPRRFPPLQRDIVLFAWALGGGFYEITFGGARPSALAFLSGILLSPILMRADEVRRRNNQEAPP
jgi:hypothetical protein